MDYPKIILKQHVYGLFIETNLIKIFNRIYCFYLNICLGKQKYKFYNKRFVTRSRLPAVKWQTVILFQVND